MSVLNSASGLLITYMAGSWAFFHCQLLFERPLIGRVGELMRRPTLRPRIVPVHPLPVCLFIHPSFYIHPSLPPHLRGGVEFENNRLKFKILGKLQIFLEKYLWSIPQINKEKPKDYNMEPVGF